MKEFNIKLFKSGNSCKDCQFSWNGYLTGFSRAHSVLENEKILLFIADDIYYDFPKDDFTEVDVLFFNEGFVSVDQCPNCKSFNLSPQKIIFENEVELKCYEIQISDLFKDKENWKIKKETLDKLRDYT